MIYIKQYNNEKIWIHFLLLMLIANTMPKKVPIVMGFWRGNNSGLSQAGEATKKHMKFVMILVQMKSITDLHNLVLFPDKFVTTKSIITHNIVIKWSLQQ